MKSFLEVFNDLPTSAGERGSHFERLSKWWLLQDPIWASKLKNVWLWDEWPERNNKDTGIDLVAEARDGELWAIQCKCYSPDTQLNKRDVDSFLSESSRKVFGRRLLITTTKELGPNLRKSLEHQEKQVLLVDWSTLADSPVDWAAFQSTRTGIKRPKKVLRPHQKRAVKKVLDGFRSENRGQLVMACGTGKTLTGLRIKEALSPKITVVLVPSLTLLSQTLKDWLIDRVDNFNWLAVCSDDSVSKDSEDNSRLIDYSFPTTTSPSEIVNFLKSDGPKVIFSTYQSSKNLTKALKESSLKVDLLLADEAHRLAGSPHGDFGVFLSDENARVSKRLFLTATPRVFSSATKASSESLGYELVSMDNSEIFGRTFFRFSFGQAIEAQMLTDYRVVVLGVDERQIEDLIKERALVSLEDEATDALSLATHVALELAMKRWGLRRVISFHSRISRARQFATLQLRVHNWLPKELANSRGLQVETVTSGQPTSSRRRILDKFSSLSYDQALLVTNARCLTEGVDIPNLDGVVFADPRSSKIDIVQAVGRAIRLGEESKSHGTIVLPVVVPRGSNSTTELEQSNFSTVWSVLNALQSHDESLLNELAGLRRSLGQLKSVSTLPSRIHLDLPASVTKDFAEKIRIMIVDRSTDSWEERFGELLAFHEKHGHTRIKQSQGRGSPRNPLGTWVAKVRSDNKKNLLSIEKVRAFEIFADWTWDPIEADWIENLDALESASIKFGDLRKIPRDYEDEDGHKVGQWFTSLRSRANSNRLELHRIEAMNLRFKSWQWDARGDQWEAGFQRAFDWFSKNESNPGPEVIIEESGMKLNNWVKVNKKAMLKKETTSVLTIERLNRLATIPGWADMATELERLSEVNSEASPAQIRALEVYIQGLHLYRAEFGNVEHPITVNRQSFVYREYPLGQAANRYRAQYKSGKLPDWIIGKLESIEGWVWNPLDDAWDSYFESLSKYAKNRGHSSVPQGEVFEGIALGSWVARQRRIKKGQASGTLTANQIAKLESLPGWLWDASTSRNTETRDRAWRAKYDLLKIYAGKTGAATPPANEAIDGVYLGRWVSTQRAIKKGTNKVGKLTASEVELLEQLPGWKW